MSSAPTVADRPDQDILDEAADWLVLLQSGEASARDRAALTRWRQLSPDHEAAWQRAETVLATFRQVPAAVGQKTLARLPDRGRRRALGMAGLAVPLAWLAWRQTPWQTWTSDLSTAVGEQRTVSLADGTRLTLNTATAVDVVFDREARRLQLIQGEILITTASERPPDPRPFTVRTAQGSLRPLGTRFSVQVTGDRTRVTVFEGTVEIHPVAGAEAALVAAGQQRQFTTTTFTAPEAAEADTPLWTRGMLLARDLRLDALIAELSRYHHRILRCDAAVAGLTVSGAFPVTDVHASLALLEQTLPVRADRFTPWWITVRAR